MKILLILLLFIFACEKTQRTENKTDLKEEVPLNSSEYKLLLNPEMFENYESGFENYWKIIQETAKAEGIPVILSEEPLKLNQREISFFDTPNMDLRKSGYLLRQRVKYSDGNKKPGIEFSVKFRRTNPEDAVAVDLSLSDNYTAADGEIELESDIVYYSKANGKEQTTYTISNKIIMDEQPEMNFSTFAKIYPALSKLSIPANTILNKVASISVDEWKVVLGDLDFGKGLHGSMDMTIWILETEAGQIKIPEFSFDHPYNLDKVWDKEAMLKCTTFINKLNDAHPEWVVPGSSKATALFEMN